MNKLTDSIYNRKLDVHYNVTPVYPGIGNLKGKIRCPILNESISSLTCARMMDKKDWPREIDPDICKKANCYVCLSIIKHSQEKQKEIPNANRPKSN